MAQLVLKPCSDIITSQTRTLAPPSSQKSRNLVVRARGLATTETAAGAAATSIGRRAASATATEVVLTDGLPAKTLECLAGAVPGGINSQLPIPNSQSR